MNYKKLYSNITDTDISEFEREVRFNVVIAT